MNRRTSAFLVAACACSTLCMTATYADGYPCRLIRLSVGYSPAGTADLAARILAEDVGKRLGQTI